MDLSALDLGILGPAMVAGLLVLATHVPLGTQVLDRGIVFIDLAIAQIAGGPAKSLRRRVRCRHPLRRAAGAGHDRGADRSANPALRHRCGADGCPVPRQRNAEPPKQARAPDGCEMLRGS